jgi:hypothetical protein
MMNELKFYAIDPSAPGGGGFLSALVSGGGAGEATTNFKVNVRDYLGLENTKFKNNARRMYFDVGLTDNYF